MKKYKIKEYDYKKYVEINGEKFADCPQALEIRDNGAKYFIIKENNKFYDDFCVFAEDNLISLYFGRILNDELMKMIFSYLKNDYGYDYITFYIPNTELEIIEKIKNTYNVEIIDYAQGQYFYKKMKINL